MKSNDAKHDQFGSILLKYFFQTSINLGMHNESYLHKTEACYYFCSMLYVNDSGWGTDSGQKLPGHEESNLVIS